MTAKMYQAKLNGAMIKAGTITSLQVQDGSIVDADINALAGIAGTKLGTGGITNLQISSLAAIDANKLAHVGAGNVLRSNGTQNVGGKLTSADLGTGIAPRGVTLVVAASNASQKVKDTADYVCAGLSTGGDQVQINAALAALPSWGGTVLLSEGTFQIDGQIATVKDGTTLRGMSWWATQIVAATGAGAGVNTTLVNIQHTYCVLEELTVFGNKTNHGGKTLMRCVSMGGANGILRNVLASDSVGDSVYINGDGALLLNVVSRNAGAVGFILGSPNTTGFRVGRVQNCAALTNGTHGFYLASLTWLIEGCHSYGNTAVGFVSTSGAPVCAFVDCLAYTNTQTGFLIEGGETVLSGCEATSHPSAPGFQSNAASVVFTGCTSRFNTVGFILNGSYNVVSGSLAKSNSNYGIQILQSASAAVGNVIQANTLHGLLLQASGSSAIGNQLYANGTGGGVYGQLYVSTADFAHVVGNIVRLLGNTSPNYACVLISSNNVHLDGNDFYNGGTVAELSDGSTTTRRASIRRLLYTAGVLASGTAMTTLVEVTILDVSAATTFYVASQFSTVTITIRMGVMFKFTTGTGSVGTYVRLDSAAGATMSGTLYKLSSIRGEVGAGYVCCPGGTVVLTNLAIGNHTLKVTGLSEQTGVFYLRGSGAISTEFLEAEVVEVQGV